MSEKKEEKSKNFRSLTTTLIVVFLSLTIITLLISGSLQLYFNIQAQQKIIMDEQSFIAKNAADTVKNFIRREVSIIETTARTINLSYPETQKRALSSLMIEPALRQVFFFNTEKEEVARVSRLSKFELGCFTEEVKEDLFLKTFQRKEYISEVCIDKATNEPMIILAVPVIDVLGYFQGILVAEVNLKLMWNLITQMKIGKNGLIYVVDKQGNLIAFYDISRVLKKENLSYLEEVNKFIKEEKVTQITTAKLSKGIQGNYVITNHISLGEPNWAVVVELPAIEAYQPVIQSIFFSLGVIILCSIFAIMVGIFLAKRITQPIIDLRNIALEIKKGKMTARANIETNNEISELATTFNEMAERLSSYIENLEEKVKERTKELEEAKNILEIKVEARTKDLKELAKNLENQVNERTKELQEKINELERFQKLAVGRELKMIELKKEIKRLEKELEKYNKK